MSELSHNAVITEIITVTLTYLNISCMSQFSSSREDVVSIAGNVI